jgi:two-component system, LuxR family, sensor kinase FixL
MPTRLSVLGVRIPEKAIQRRRVLPLALALVVVVTLIEWHLQFAFSLGIFYTLPVIVAATVLNRMQTVGFAVLCAATRGVFTPATSEVEFFLKFVMASIAYCATGLLVVEMSNNRRRMLEHYARVQLEQDLRRRAEEQLRILAESSPAAILTINARCEVQAANRAAHEILGCPGGKLVGRNVASQFPVFADALELSFKDRSVRTSISGWAKRMDDQVFPIQAWFSVYEQGGERRLAAIVVDMSEEVRDRERENFQHLLDYNRLLASAVSHEIRNMCSAISVVCSNLSERTDVRGNADFDALTQLVQGLSRLASFRLQSRADSASLRADLRSVLDQLRVVIEPDWEELGGEVVWEVPDTLAPVTGDSYGLLQIFLNLAQNSLRAVENSEQRQLRVRVTGQNGDQDAVITFQDSGPGVRDPETLFHPFRPGADGSGLGLYISRELARSFGGQLEHVRGAAGGEFRVIIPFAQRAVAGAGAGAYRAAE